MPPTSIARSPRAGDVGERVACGALELGDREVVGRVDEVEAVVRTAARSAGVGLAVPMSMPR